MKKMQFPSLLQTKLLIFNLIILIEIDDDDDDDDDDD
jgi:hypothetical protein